MCCLAENMTTDLHVLQIGSDDDCSLYQIQINGRPEAELQMESLRGVKGMRTKYASVRLLKDGKICDVVCVPEVLGRQNNAHKLVEQMLREHYQFSEVVWYTKGSHAKVS